MSRPSETRSRVITCRGARATEEILFEELEAAIAGSEGSAHPIRIVVPSKSLRQHLLCRMAQRRGAVVGVIVQTAYAAAREIVERCGAPAPVGDGFFELVVRRLAATERPLASNLENLEDGFGTVVGAVRDLLDAGFRVGHEDAVLERLEDLERPLSGRRLQRARAIVRVAARSWEAMAAAGGWRSAHAFATAESLVRDLGVTALPASAILVHGFADLTGLVADFLEAVTRALPTVVLIDRPSRPGDGGRDEPGLRFLERLEARFSAFVRVEADSEQAPPRVLLTAAADVEAEARWVAERVRALLDEGKAAEEIGIVARNFDGLSYPLRRHLRRLAVPWSGVGESVAGGGCRRDVLRLIEVLHAGPATPVDLWIEGREEPASGHGLLLGLAELGLVRVQDVASLDRAGSEVTGVRIHLDLLSEGDDAEPPSRWVPAAVIRAAAREAATLCRIFDEWPRIADPATHAGWTQSLLDGLGWRPDWESSQGVASRTAMLAAELAPSHLLEKQEWIRLAVDRLRGFGDDPIGGAGGGVQLLNVTEARARTFGHLFVVGFNRGRFPRTASDDPLLPDIIRTRLAMDVLPEMPVRARSADEERYLFAQIVSSAPRVEISWHLAAKGSAASRSPFAADLLPGNAPDPLAPPVWTTARADLGPRPAWEHAVLTAERGDRRDFGRMLAAALADGGSQTMAERADEIAKSRADVLEQIDPERSSSAASPWFGFVGPDAPDDRGPTVTHLEAVAQCPWASFVIRRLGVAPRPDPQLGLPDPRGLLVGQVVHRVLERVVVNAVGETAGLAAEKVGERPAVPALWPSEPEFEVLLAQVAHEVATASGLGTRGMSTLLAARSRPYLEVARRVEWGADGRLEGVVAAEVEGRAPVDAADRPVRFRADRADRGADGIRLTDYKTGKPASNAQGAGTRRKHLLAEVGRGRTLQAAAYAVGAGVGASGRYLWLRPEIGDAPEEAREAVVAAADLEFAAAFAEAVTTVELALGGGVAFPRVEEVGSDKLPDHCTHCAVAEACRRDDSGFRRRLVEWMTIGGGSTESPEGVARRLWHLGAPPERSS
jgi:RecB family exonuclease